MRMQMCHNCSLEMLSAVLYNFPLGFHKTALQELREKLELLSVVINNMQQMLKKHTVLLKFTWTELKWKQLKLILSRYFSEWNSRWVCWWQSCTRDMCRIWPCMERSDTCMSLNPSPAHFLSQTLSREPETESRGVQKHHKHSRRRRDRMERKRKEKKSQAEARTEYALRRTMVQRKRRME